MVVDETGGRETTERKVRKSGPVVGASRSMPSLMSGRNAYSTCMRRQVEEEETFQASAACWCR